NPGQRTRRCHADVENIPIGSPESLVHPSDKPASHVGRVELVIHQTIHAAKHQRSVVRPSARGLMMRAVTAHVLDRIGLHCRPVPEFHWNTQRVTDERTPKATEYPVFG